MINHLWHAWVILEENNCCNCLFALSLKFNRLKSKVMRSQDSLKFSDKKEAKINKIRSLVCKLSSTPEKLGWCKQPRKWKMLNCSSMPCRRVEQDSTRSVMHRRCQECDWSYSKSSVHSRNHLLWLHIVCCSFSDGGCTKFQV